MQDRALYAHIGRGRQRAERDDQEGECKVQKSYKVYQCPYCKDTYDTLKEARECAKPFKEKFKVGDIIQNHGSNRVWKVSWIRPESVTLARVNEAILLKGFDGYRSHWQDKVTDISPVVCHDRWHKVTAEEIEKELNRRRRQVAAGENLLEMLGCPKKSLLPLKPGSQPEMAGPLVNKKKQKKSSSRSSKSGKSK